MSDSVNDADGTTPDREPARDAASRATEQGSSDRERVRHTRTSAAWVGVAVVILLGIGLVDFIAQNTPDVHVEFFWAGGRMPLAVAMLAAALAGALLVLAVGIGRVAQLRLGLRRQRRRHEAEHQNPANGASESSGGIAHLK